MDFGTRCVHGGDQPRDPSGSISVPIHQTATYAHPGVGQTTGFDYSRIENPTRNHLERLLADLEQGDDAIALSSGMAAIATVMELLSPGDHVVASADLYGGTIRLFRTVSAKNGITFTAVDTGDAEAIVAAITPSTKMVFVETPTNPMMHVTDIAAVAAVTSTRGLLLVVDNTFLSPAFQQPLALGADIVVHSGTKYLGGHNDSLAGFIVVKGAELAEQLRAVFGTVGACLSPFDSWLQIRGIKTLHLRLREQSANALALAGWLRTHPKVKAVHYVGLPDHPGYAIMQRQCTGFGAMLSFEVDTADTATALLNRVRVLQYAESLGGVESLITYPFTQTHADVPEDERIARGINDRLLRFSVGIEAIDDLIADLAQALA